MATQSRLDMPWGDKDIESRAELLCAMDCVMHHLNDEYAMESWLAVGVPDGLPWDIMNPAPLASRREDYEELVRNCTRREFEEYVRLFVSILKEECFKLKYAPMALI